MKFEVTTLSSAVRAALSWGAVAIMAATCSAFAQETGQAAAQTADAESASTTQLQGIVVTGSMVRRVDLETANPVISVDRAAIAASGKVTVGDLLQDLPSMTGGNANPQVNQDSAEAGTGASTMSLRGLGPNRSLVLVDGRRVLSQDVNSIPANMIERIDVLKTGASAIYGSDAIGGAVNFVTRTGYTGGQISLDYGESSRGDGVQRGYTATYGTTTDKAKIVVGAGYNKTDLIDSTAREFSKAAIAVAATPGGGYTVFPGGSSSSEFGHVQIPAHLKASFPGCASGYLARNPGASGRDPVADYHCYQNSGPNSDLFNTAPGSLILTPSERSSAFVLASYDITQDISAYMNGYYTAVHGASRLGGVIYQTGTDELISPDSYYNPFGVEFSKSGYKFANRLVSNGNRTSKNSVDIAQFSTGFRGAFDVLDRDWQWDVGMDYGHRTALGTGPGALNIKTLYTGPSFLDPVTGTVTCGYLGSPTPNCDASYDPFVTDSPNTIAAINANRVYTLSRDYSQEKIWRVDLNGSVVDLPAGTVQLALGGRYRQEASVNKIDPMVQLNPTTGSCPLGSGCTVGMSGHFNVKEVFAEVFIPLLHDLPGIQSLNVTIGDRYSRFSTFGSTNNMKFAVEWKPISDLLLRGTAAEVFRAPNIDELYSARSGISAGLTSDPCDGYTGNPVDPACVNVPTDGSFLDEYVAAHTQAGGQGAGAILAGFPIKPESGKSFDVGAVYSPSWLTGFSSTVDIWHLYLNDIITQVQLQSLLNLCSAGQTVFCPFIQRIPAGPQHGQIDGTKTIQPVGNLGSTSVSGIDIGFAYRLPMTPIGAFTAQLNGTYMKRYNQQTAPGTSGNVTYYDVGHFFGRGSAQAAACPGASQCLFPRIRGNALADWHLDNWSASWRMKYVHSFRMGSPSPSQDTHPGGSKVDGFFLDYGSRLYHDVQLGYDFKDWHTRVDVGVRNLFDKQPPLLFDNNTGVGETDPRNFDTVGRYYWARLTFQF